MNITWVLEAEAFRDNEEALKEAAKAAGHRVVAWNDEWIETRKWPVLEGERVVFHGSLENASYIHRNISWEPGAFCRSRVPSAVVMGVTREDGHKILGGRICFRSSC